MEVTDYLRVLRSYWVGVAAIFLVGVMAAAIWSFFQPRVYTAEASGYVAAQGATDLETSMVGDQLAQAKVKSYLDIGTWRVVAEYAIEQLGLQMAPEELVDQVKVTNPTNTVIIQVSASAGTPEAARDLAEVWMRGIIQQVEKIETPDAKTPLVTVIAGDSARLPTSPSSPRTGLNLALGALIGLLLGLGYAVVRDRMDQRIRSAKDIERTTGVSVVGGLPFEASLVKEPRLLPRDGSRTDRSMSALAESFRGLRTNLQYMSVDNPPRAIVITSPLPGDGKSFTAANLAITIAAAGQQVVLIDGDLRKPRLASLFGLSADAGLTDVLAGRAPAADVLQPGDVSGNLQVLPAGPIPPNPSELIGSRRMKELVESLSAHALVIIDAPPLLPVTDAAVLSTRADGALVIARAGKTTYEMLERALANLDLAKGTALGVVLNRVPTTGAGKGAYGYQYAGDYHRSHGREADDRTPAVAATSPRPGG